MASPKAEEGQDGQNNDDKTDEIDESVHEFLLVPAPCQFTICRDRQSSRKREQHGVLVSPALRRFSPARSSPGGRDSRITAEPRSPCDGNQATIASMIERTFFCSKGVIRSACRDCRKAFMTGAFGTRRHGSINAGPIGTCVLFGT
jgi:hypothetical protein